VLGNWLVAENNKKRLVDATGKCGVNFNPP
jgi:hypothetical protein